MKKFVEVFSVIAMVIAALDQVFRNLKTDQK